MDDLHNSGEEVQNCSGQNLAAPVIEDRQFVPFLEPKLGFHKQHGSYWSTRSHADIWIDLAYALRNALSETIS